MREIIDKPDFIEIKNFFSVNNVKRMRRQVTDWEKIFAKCTSERVLLSKIYKEIPITQQLKKIIKKWAKYFDTLQRRYTDRK